MLFYPFFWKLQVFRLQVLTKVCSSIRLCSRSRLQSKLSCHTNFMIWKWLLQKKMLYRQAPIGESQQNYRPLGFWINLCPLLQITNLHLKTAPGSQLDVVKTECLAVGHEVTHATRTAYYLIHIIIKLDIHGSILLLKSKYEIRPEQVQKARGNCMSRRLKFLWYPLLLLHCFSLYAQLGKSLWPVNMEEKAQTWFPSASAWRVSTSHKWITVALKPHSGVFLETVMKRYSLNRAELLVIWTVHSAWKKRWPEVQIYSDS